LLQATPYSKLEKKVVELPGGEQAVESTNITHIGGWDILDNNQVYLLPLQLLVMSFEMSGHVFWRCDGGNCLLMVG
jgi:hypothetical protein